MARRQTWQCASCGTETGYAGAALRRWASCTEPPAIMNNRCHMYVAYDVEWAGEPEWDATEDSLWKPSRSIRCRR